MKIEKQIKKLTEFALDIVSETENITVKYFKKSIKPKFKQNKTPVTEADFKCEDYLIKKIRKKFPDHSILSEERGEIKNDSGFKWIIDPVDGTRNFLRGYPFWGTLLALEYDNEVVLGIIFAPAMDITIWGAKGQGSFNKKKRLHVSKISVLDKSYLLHGGLGEILKQGYRENFFALVGKCAYSRGYGDYLGHMYVSTGKAEIMVDPHVAPYDIASTKIIIEEAGGKLTDIYGNETIYNETALATNGKLHDEVLKILH